MTLPRTMRIDAHQHFWDFSESEYAWIVEGGLAALERDFAPEDLRPLLDAHGIDGSVAVQARQSLAETEWLLGLAGRHPWILGVVGWVDLAAPGLVDQLTRLRRGRGGERLVGVRHVIQDEPDGFMDASAFRRGLGALAGFGLVYDLLIYERQMEEAVRLCASLPEQPIVLDHLGKPAIREGRIEGWRGGLRELGAMEHVSVKLSGLVTEADHAAWTAEELVPYLEAALEAFGPARLMFGSDWPVCTLAAPYAAVLEVIESWSGALSASERDQLFGGTAARVYRVRR